MKNILKILLILLGLNNPFDPMDLVRGVLRIFVYSTVFLNFGLAGYSDYVSICDCVTQFESTWILCRSRLLEESPLLVSEIDNKLVVIKQALSNRQFVWDLHWNPDQQRCWLELVDQFPGMVNGVGNDLVFIESSIKFIDTLLAIV